MFISKNLYVCFPQKTVENSQISQYFARKIEILHLHFCRHFWNDVYMCPIVKTFIPCTPLTDWWRVFTNGLLGTGGQLISATWNCVLSTSFVRVCFISFCFRCNFCYFAMLQQDSPHCVKLQIWPMCSENQTQSRIFCVGRLGAQLLICTCMFFLVPKRVVWWFVSFYICSFGGLYLHVCSCKIFQ